MPCLVIPLLTFLRLSHLDGIVAAHAIVRIHKPLAADSPFGSMGGIYTLRGTTNILGISLGPSGNLTRCIGRDGRDTRDTKAEGVQAEG